jgi:hypothetical protein
MQFLLFCKLIDLGVRGVHIYLRMVMRVRLIQLENLLTDFDEILYERFAIWKDQKSLPCYLLHWLNSKLMEAQTCKVRVTLTHLPKCGGGQ